jgi:hypothetical protein
MLLAARLMSFVGVCAHECVQACTFVRLHVCERMIVRE